MDQNRRYVTDLEEGEKLEQPFLVQDRELRRSPNGSNYLACLLTDRTGTVAGRWWKANEEHVQALPRGGFVRVKGRTHNHRGQLQLIIESAEPVSNGDLDLADYIPSTEQDVNIMWEELLDHLRTIENLHLRRLIDEFVTDQDIAQRFQRAPAASSMHHAYLGGLLEHTLHVIRLVRAVAPLYAGKINIDLLLTGAFLHDIGKIEELSSEPSIGYTDRGNLIGHINTAIVWVQQKADAVTRETGSPFPQEIVDLVQHLILSHHGSPEYGSPKRPMVPEALMLNYLDNLDAKVEMSTRTIEEDADLESSFTPHHRGLDARLFKRSRELPE